MFWITNSYNSYPLAVDIYFGRQPEMKPEYNKPEKIGYKLSRRWHNQGRKITGDNFFTSIDLAERFFAINSTYVGTVR